MRSTIAMFLFLFLWTAGFAQTDTYKKAKIYLKNHRILKVNNLQISGSNIDFLNPGNSKQEEVSLNDITLIKKARGSHYLEGALFGAGALALSALIIDIQPDDPLNIGVERDHGVGFYLGMTAGGAAAGALIGALFPKWRTIYSGGKFIGMNLPLRIDFNSKSNVFNIKVSISL